MCLACEMAEWAAMEAAAVASKAKGRKAKSRTADDFICEMAVETKKPAKRAAASPRRKKTTRVKVSGRRD